MCIKPCEARLGLTAQHAESRAAAVEHQCPALLFDFFPSTSWGVMWNQIGTVPQSPRTISKSSVPLHQEASSS